MIHTAIYIQDGITQLVLTPGTKLDQQVLDELQDNITRVRVHRGEFYASYHGYIREKGDDGYTWYGDRQSEKSLIFVLDKTPKPAEVPNAVPDSPSILDSPASSPVDAQKSTPNLPPSFC